MPRRAKRKGEMLAGSHQEWCCDTLERLGGGFGVSLCRGGGADAACGELARAVVSRCTRRGVGRVTLVGGLTPRCGGLESSDGAVERQ